MECGKGTALSMADEKDNITISAVNNSLELSIDPDDHQRRKGTVWTGFAHVITGVIGAGILSLAWSVAQLGWIAGPLTIVLFAAITQVCNILLTDCYRAPDPATGPTRNRSFIEAVKFFLGKKRQTVCGMFLFQGFYGFGIAYTIVTASCMKAILRSDCYHEHGRKADCHYGDNMFMLLFGIAMIIVSQIPDFHNMTWLSVIATIMSFSYASIGFGLGFATAVENREIKGSIGGISTHSSAQKVWLVFQALGDISFAFPYTQIVLEIQDTLKSPPSENRAMRKITLAAILVTTFFFLCCSCFGYAAFGDDTPGNLLTGFGFYEPYWLVDFANACIILHLFGAYQVYSQPVFAFVEKWLADKFPQSKFTNKFYTFRIPLLPAFRLNMLRLAFRTAYVVSTTGVAMVFPYFNQVLGVLGALNFWPIAVYFPVEMYLVQSKTRPWTRKWIVLQAFSMFCLLLSVVALIGSVEGLMRAKLS